MKILSFIFSCGIVLQIVGCNAKDVYQTTQHNQQRACDRMPEGSRRDDCLAEIGPDYHQYEKQRKKLEQQHD